MSAKRCTWCNNLSDPRLEHCWVCGGQLVSTAMPAVPGPKVQDDTLLRALGWLALLGGLAFVSLIVGNEIGANWPGLLIPYGLGMLVVFGALGGSAWVNLKAARPEGSELGKRSRGEMLFAGVALGITGLVVVLVLLMLLMLAAIIIFMMVCYAFAIGMSL